MTIQQVDVKQHIIDTARPIILGKGFTGVGLSELLGAAQVPKGSFYHYFKSKELFGEALLNNYFDNYMVRMEGILGGTERPASERLMSYWQCWMETQMCDDDAESKCLVVKIACEVADLSEPMRLALDKGTAKIIARLAQCIDEARVEGSLPNSLNASQTAQVLYHQWIGATMLTKIRRDSSALEVSMIMTLKLLCLSELE